MGVASARTGWQAARSNPANQNKRILRIVIWTSAKRMQNIGLSKRRYLRRKGSRHIVKDFAPGAKRRL